ncbi:ShlB/FhaC/HecB family hemolysin secretion/activation protein [Synechococcus sp. PCC 7336]|uniref:ShlB/FhaC/HecB family hemolysin secretion/activation protein n=1 Tax=Synechococcus sp. PCC 7336 TaxID=195250 RepID=UPI0003481E57|nr:POTRA domain-containing protein [Synechococcus sp. PCC 7336]
MCSLPLLGIATPTVAQTDPSLEALPFLDPTPPETEPAPTQPLPPLEDLFPNLHRTPSPQSPYLQPSLEQNQFVVKEFRVEGSTIFSAEDLAKETEPFTNRPIGFNELLEVRTAISQLYISTGYLTSAAFIPPQTLAGGVVVVEVVEGTLDEIEVSGTNRLNPRYVRSRLQLAADPPLNVDRLLERLQLLRLDSRIDNLSAELSAGAQPGSSVLAVSVQEANTVAVDVRLDSGRSPSAGGLRREGRLREDNLFGQGDSFVLLFDNTDGSNVVQTSYTYPITPRGNTVSLAYARSWSEIIEEPFDVLEVEAVSDRIDLALTHPILRTPHQELSLRLEGTYRASQIEFLDGLPFPSRGADEDGRLELAVVRFSQDWLLRQPRQAIAARSQFNFGIDVQDALPDGSGVDGDFFVWRGQAQWARRLAPQSLVLLRGDVQLADRPLVGSEQFRLGGLDTVRGFRQDLRLTDNGALLSAEVRLPIFQDADGAGVIQAIPFVDLRAGWNNGELEAQFPNGLASAGLSLSWQWQDRLSARINYGVPLVDVDTPTDTLQDSGLSFAVRLTFF